MNEKLKKSRYKLKIISKRLEEAVTKQEIDGLKDEIKLLEEEINELDNEEIKKHYFTIVKTIRTKEEAYLLRKEIKTLKRDVSSKKEEIDEKEVQLTDKNSDKDKALEELSVLEEISQKMVKAMEEMLKNVKTIEKRANLEIEIEETVEIVKRRQSVLLDTLLLIYVAKSNMEPLVKVPLTMYLVNEIYDKLQVKDEEIIHIEYHYEDIDNVIKEAMDSIDDLESEMETTLYNIKEIRKDFNKKFGEYKNVREFNEIFDMLDLTESVISKEYTSVSNVKKSLEKSSDINQEKVLKLSA